MVAVGADRPGVEGLARAERAGVPTFVQRLGDHADRPQWDAALTALVAGARTGPSRAGRLHEAHRHAFLAGIRGALRQHPSRAVAVLPRDARARPTPSRYGVKVTGATLFVVDAGMDTGPIVAQTAVPVEDDDDVERLHERIKVAERAMLVASVGRMAREGFTITDRQVRFGSCRRNRVTRTRLAKVGTTGE